MKNQLSTIIGSWDSTVDKNSKPGSPDSVDNELWVVRSWLGYIPADCIEIHPHMKY